MDKTIKPLVLEVDREIWEKFKKLVDRDTRLVDAVAHLIHDFVSKGNRMIDLSKAK